MVEHLLKGLNESQKEAVMATEGYVRVIAGAGSGKTKTLVNRYVYLVEALGIAQNNILCVTFTNKAAAQMKKRVKSLLQESSTDGFIATYHGFCARVLRDDIHHIHYPKNFMILDVDDQERILSEIYDELNLTIKFMKYADMLKDISKFKSVSRKFYISLLTDPTKEIVITEDMDTAQKVLFTYLKKQRKYFALDFQDLLYFTIYLFYDNEEVKMKWQNRLHYIMVDEFQDSSKSQIELLNILSEKHKNLFVVGDPDQSIYAWRGADPEYLVTFDKVHTPCQTILLNQNYRSTPEILAVGNDIIKKNKIRVDKDLFTNVENGEKAYYYHAKNEIDEVKYITTIINEYVQKNKASYKDFSILYRANYNSRFIEQGLMQANIPYIMYSGFKFFERAEIKDAISYLRMVLYADDLSFIRTINNPKRRFGKAKLSFIKEKAASDNLTYYQTLIKYQNHHEILKTTAQQYIDTIEYYRKNYASYLVSDLLRELLDKSGYDKQLRLSGNQENIDNINELLTSIVNFESSYGEPLSLDIYLQQLALMTDTDREDRKDSVKLMTIHVSKGLEFPYVFIAACNDGTLPTQQAIQSGDPKKIEEERRIIHVAVTRAMKELHITESEGFTFRGDKKIPSRFLFEVPLEKYELKGSLDKEIIQHMIEFAEKDITFTVKEEELMQDDVILHPIFGEGFIEKVDKENRLYMIYFHKLKTTKPIKMSFQGMTRI